MDTSVHTALLIALLPLIAVVGLLLNLFIRARGGRSFKLRLKGFGVDLTVETLDSAYQRSHIRENPTNP